MTYAVDDPDAAFGLRPYRAQAVHEGGRLRLAVDAETRRPVRLVEHRNATVRARSEGESRSTRERARVIVETTFHDYASVDLGPPTVDGEPLTPAPP